MKNYRFEMSPLLGTIVVGFIGAVIGLVVAEGSSIPPPFGAVITLLPQPYRLPKVPGGTALRLAMVHDVLHERYLRHGSAWYKQRNADAEKIIASQGNIHPPSEAYLSAMDDLAVGLEQLGEMDRAIKILRQKMLLVSPLPPFEMRPESSPPTRETEFDDLDKILATHLSPLQKQQYTACANLGTVLLLASLQQAMTGDVTAKKCVKESLDLIERAIAINPYGHFGREIWQAITIEGLLGAIEKPELLGHYDLLGDPLDDSFSSDFMTLTYWYNRQSLPDDATVSADERCKIRLHIPQTCISPEWAKVVHPDYQQSMPFDEPTLAIIGMWTMGGGPNPHFALALGRIMEGVKQHSIAWNAYQRAIELSDTFWPDPTVRKKLVEYCNTRQHDIAKVEAPGNVDAWQHDMQKQHSEELAWGIAYQNVYHDYEAGKIALGRKLDDPDFYKTFFTGRPNIASEPGLADDLIVKNLRSDTQALVCAVLGAGIGMTLSIAKSGKKTKRMSSTS